MFLLMAVMTIIFYACVFNRQASPTLQRFILLMSYVFIV